MQSSPQSTSKVLMVRPNRFRFNDQTAVNNYYQDREAQIRLRSAETDALSEFHSMVRVLRDKEIDVEILDTPAGLDIPDAVFPNNWISFHPGNGYVLYSMFAPNRRLERSVGLDPACFPMIAAWRELYSFVPHELENRFLEGTGSLVLDRMHKIAYAAISERTDPALAREFGQVMGYRVVLFRAFQQVVDQRLPIYHTNVMMSVGTGFALVCDACIDDVFEREQVMRIMEDTGREIIRISEQQTASFAGNALEVTNAKGQKFIVMSSRAFHSLDKNQIESLCRHGEILHSDLTTIETLGGGSARCMIAEIFQ